MSAVAVSVRALTGVDVGNVSKPPAVRVTDPVGWHRIVDTVRFAVELSVTAPPAATALTEVLETLAIETLPLPDAAASIDGLRTLLRAIFRARARTVPTAISSPSSWVKKPAEAVNEACPVTK